MSQKLRLFREGGEQRAEGEEEKEKGLNGHRVLKLRLVLICTFSVRKSKLVSQDHNQ